FAIDWRAGVVVTSGMAGKLGVEDGVAPPRGGGYVERLPLSAARLFGIRVSLVLLPNVRRRIAECGTSLGW
ncbi:MAG TPA: hypothetical protein VIG47_03540, partial [Gemmatimonadaceae bacterium]